MKKIANFLLVSSLLMFLFYGCVPLVPIVAVTAAGGTYSVTADSITDSIDKPREILIEQFIKVIKRDGALIISSSIAEGSVSAEKGNYKIYFSTKEVNEKITRFTIRARKGYNTLPDKEEAIRIYNLFKKELQ